MLVQKYFSTVPDVIYNHSEYCSAYRVLIQFYSAGLSPELRSSENSFPSVTLCNCIHTILDVLSDIEKLRPYLDDYHQQLQPVPEAKNPRPETLPSAVYDCSPTTDAERCAVMALTCAVGAAEESLNPDQVRQFKRWLSTHKDHYADARILLDAFSATMGTTAPISPSTFDLLSDYCIGITAMDFIEKAMTGMNAQQKDKFVASITEMFLGDSYRLNRLIGGMMVYRYEVLSRENEAIEAANDAAASPPIASVDEGKSKGATADQLALLFYYLFNELHIDFTNSDKMAWARLINFISGHSIENLRKYLNIKFDKKSVQQDLGIVQAALQELFPTIAQKIENDKQG